MSKQTDAYFRGIPTKPYDLLKEGIIMFAIIAVVVVVLAIIFSSPDYPPVRSQDVANYQPLAFLQTSAAILSGNNDIRDYGPPYNRDTGNAQRILGVAPADLLGVTIPINPREDFIIEPLKRAAVLNPQLAAALQSFESAPADRQNDWISAYRSALNSASVDSGQVKLPAGDYGPVPVMMNGMLSLGKAGLLEGALESDKRLPFSMDFTRSLLFFQDDVDHSVAKSLDMLGEQWGISTETGPYPGAWWLWPYTFLYQIPPMSVSANGDLQVGVIMGILFLLIFLAPFIPVLNRIPRWSRIYRIIWRDWYK